MSMLCIEVGSPLRRKIFESLRRLTYKSRWIWWGRSVSVAFVVIMQPICKCVMVEIPLCVNVRMVKKSTKTGEHLSRKCTQLCIPTY